MFIFSIPTVYNVILRYFYVLEFTEVAAVARNVVPAKELQGRATTTGKENSREMSSSMVGVVQESVQDVNESGKISESRSCLN